MLALDQMRLLIWDRDVGATSNWARQRVPLKPNVNECILRTNAWLPMSPHAANTPLPNCCEGQVHLGHLVSMPRPVGHNINASPPVAKLFAESKQVAMHNI